MASRPSARFVVPLLAAGLVLALAGAGRAVTVTFQDGLNGYVGTVDTSIESGAPATIRGSEAFFEWDGDSGGSLQIGLLRFDDIFGEEPGRIPPESIIHSATLTCTVSNIGDAGTLSEALVAWDESTTYGNFGGDSGVQADEFRTPAVAAVDGSSTGEKSVDVTASLADWSMNPAANRGWIIQPTGTDGVQVRSREYATVTARPRLTVDYTPNVPHVRFTPLSISGVVGGGDPTVTVIISSGSNADRDVHLTLTSNDPAVACFAGGAASTMLTYATGASSQQSVAIHLAGAGTATVSSGNDAGLLDAALEVVAETGEMAIDPAYIGAVEQRDVSVKMWLTPGSNLGRAVNVTLASDNAGVAQAAGAIDGRKTISFPAGSSNEQSVPLDIGACGLATITATSDADMPVATLQVQVFDGFMFTTTSDIHDNAQNPDELAAVLAHMASTGGPGDFMICTGDAVPPLPIQSTIEAAFGTSFPWYCVMSNHLAENGTYAQWVRDQFPRLPGIVNTGPPGCASTTYSFDRLNAHFVAINQYFNGTSDVGTDGDVIPAVQTWLNADLAATTRKWRFVFGHEPAFPQPDAATGNIRHLGDSLDKYPANRDAFWSILDQHDVVAALHGHTHRYSRYLKDGVWEVDCAQTQGVQGQYDTYLRVFVGRDEVTFHAYRSLNQPTMSLVDSWTISRPSGPTLEVNPELLDRTVRIGRLLSPDSLTVTNAGTGTLSYSIESSAEWVRFSPEDGTTSGEADTITVTYDLSGLYAGVHPASLVVTSPEAVNGSETVSIRVEIQTARCDLDGDGDVDLDDFAHLQVCFSGPGNNQSAPACVKCRLDGDIDVDASDLSVMIQCFSGAGIPTTCGP